MSSAFMKARRENRDIEGTLDEEARVDFTRFNKANFRGRILPSIRFSIPNKHVF